MSQSEIEYARGMEAAGKAVAAFNAAACEVVAAKYRLAYLERSLASIDDEAKVYGLDLAPAVE